MPSVFVRDKQKFETIDATKYNARLVRDMDDLEELVHQSGLSAHLFGRYTAQEEGKE